MIVNGTISISTFWFTCITHPGYRGKRSGAYLRVYNFPKNPFKFGSWHWSCILKGHSTILPSQQLLHGNRKCGKTSDQWITWVWATVALLWLWSEFRGQKQWCLKYHDGGRGRRYSVSPWMVVLARALCAGKANPYIKWVFYSRDKVLGFWQ